MNGRFVGPCYHCRCDMWLPEELYASARHSEKITFHCAYGHPQIFRKGDTELDVVRRERDQLKQRIAMKDDQLLQQTAAIAKLQQVNRKATRELKRLDKGVCPCCTRSFENLQRHMKTKHPDYSKGLQ